MFITWETARSLDVSISRRVIHHRRPTINSSQPRWPSELAVLSEDSVS